MEISRSYFPLLSSSHRTYLINRQICPEAVHRQFRKLTKTKGGFASENALLKLLYAAILKASERWTHPVQNWNLTLSQMAIHFPERLDEYISL